ncbi:hypothetical protein [Corynebacterium diphtheriae]|nr:hypothetical protein [Corynebacterium diphtheriae]MBG9252787.1 hypothetical protein [Corynebacterium diphtheriae bv. mitis]
MAPRIRELEFKTTETQGRHFGEKNAFCGFRVLEFEEAQNSKTSAAENP